ncbi:MAG: ATP-binding protein [Sandaracinaceae bacterium]|nr:ATP-binding protein [Sandaracinaceae bacterium]
MRLLARDGGVVTVELSSMRTLFDGGAATLILAQDVSTRRAMEARLLASDRLASLGRLAASVGHDINNPLAYVLGSLELIRDELDRLELKAEARRSFEERLGVVEQGVLRVRDVVRDLRALARADAPEEPAELCRVLDGCVQMAGHELRHRARVVREQPSGPIWIAASEGRLAQIFLNLLINAAQSIPEGSVAENEIRLEVRLEEGEAVVSVADTGMGLDPALEARIFEPFFTTKQGSGMGLGLAICRHIVGSLGGRIEVERRVPRGTVFRVHLPRAEAPARAERSVRGAQPPTAARRVLVVDDEPRIRAVLAEWLGGHHVETAASGREAIARFEQGPALDVVVCDLMMGDLTGMDVHAHFVGAGFPAERFVFVTGGEYTERARSFVEQQAAEPLIKPFTREALLTAIARASSRSRE